MDTFIEIAKQVESGNMNPLQGYVMLKQIEAQLKDCFDIVKDQAIDKAEKYGKGEHEAYGCKFQVRNAAGRWDFSNLQEHSEMKQALKDYEDGMKAAYKARLSGQVMVNQSTGELNELPEFKEGKTTISIKL